MSGKRKSNKDFCKVCLAQGERQRQAKKCSKEHYHEGCGAKVSVKRGKFACEAKHPSESVRSYIVPTKEAALKVGFRW